MKYLFIDTNVFLQIYRNSDDKHIIIDELIKLIKDKKLKIFITQQVIDEFYRNRESVLKFSLNMLNKSFSNIKVPTFCSSNRDIKKIISLNKEIKTRIGKVYNKLWSNAKNEKLDIDKLFKKLIKSTEIIQFDNKLIAMAKRRYELGNPPRKPKENNARHSYGDAINWEILLKEVPNKKNLFIISFDGDFVSDLSEEDISNFLKKEWKQRKKSEVKRYKSISRFLKDEFKTKTITKEIIKNEEVHPILRFNENPLRESYLRDAYNDSASEIGLFNSRNIISNPIEIPLLNSSKSYIPFSGESFDSESNFTLSTNILIVCRQCKNTFSNKSYGLNSCPNCGYIN